MAERKWGVITSGAEFEALATTLVFFEDAKAALFGRRGKDGGQDARSGDGTRVFQAKHHQDESASKAIADAKKEAAKIAEYRKPGHARHDQWTGVTPVAARDERDVQPNQSRGLGPGRCSALRRAGPRRRLLGAGEPQRSPGQARRGRSRVLPERDPSL